MKVVKDGCGCFSCPMCQYDWVFPGYPQNCMREMSLVERESWSRVAPLHFRKHLREKHGVFPGLRWPLSRFLAWLAEKVRP